MNRQPRPRVWTSTTLFLAMYLTFSALSMVVARDVRLSLYELFLFAQTFLLYIYIVATVRTRRDLLFIVAMLLVGLVLESLVMIGLRFVGHNITIAGISARIDGVRVGGTVGSPNGAAGYLILVLPLAAGVLLSCLRRPYKWLAMLAFSLGIVALIFTLSRGGWTSFILSMAILCLLAWRRGWLSLRALLVAACGLLLVYVLFQDTISARIAGDDASSPETRVYMMRLAFRMIEDNPVLGIGVNNFARAIEQYADAEFSGIWLHVVHNKYLMVWAETGLGGLIAFLLFLVMTIRRGWQCWKLNDGLLSPLALGLMAGIVAQMIHMFFDLFHSRSAVQLLWLVIGMIVAMSNISGTEPNVTE